MFSGSFDYTFIRVQRPSSDGGNTFVLEPEINS